MSQPMNPYDPVEPPREGMSGTSKVLLAFGIGCGVLLVLCCGVFGLGGFFMYKFAQNSQVTEPDKIRAVTDDIVEINIPESLEPKIGFDARVPFSGKPFIKGAIYSNAADNSQLIVGQIDEAFANSGDVETHMRQSMRESGHGNQQQLKTLESEDYETTINDQPAKFKISKGLDERTKDEFFEAIGSFHGKGGAAMLILRFKSPDYSKEQVMDILKSMK